MQRKAARQRPFDEKESYRWVEAVTIVDQQVSTSTRVIHAFDREGDIAEVFDCVRQLEHTGVIVRAAHDRSLDSESERLWAKLEKQPTTALNKQLIYQKLPNAKNAKLN